MANIIKQLQDADGNNIYPIAYAQGGVKMVEVWSNPSVGSGATYSNNKASFDTSLYDIYIVLYINVGGVTSGTQQILSVFDRYETATNGYSGRMYKRSAKIVSDGIQFTSGTYYATYGNSTETTADGYMIPYQIYGIKTSWIVPTTVQGLQYIEV